MLSISQNKRLFTTTKREQISKNLFAFSLLSHLTLSRDEAIRTDNVPSKNSHMFKLAYCYSRHTIESNLLLSNGRV